MIEKKINKKLKVTGINLFVLFVLLAVVELTMYFMGYQKGVIDNNPHFQKVDQLIALNGYTNDNYGILKVNDDARNYAIDYIKKNNLSNKLLFLNYLNNNNYHATPYLVGRDFLELR
ncbi:MAG: hypothetical protein HRT73_14835, partial [Flavobacteriales bacterium]|nr:hypothetical protein [Flavobacteriales bacterium]